MTGPSERHNAAARRLISDLILSAGPQPSSVNVLAESLLMGVAMFNFPGDPRRQAQIIQAISDGAQDRLISGTDLRS